MRKALLMIVVSGLTVALIAACGGGGSGGGTPPATENPLPDSSYTITTTPLMQFGNAGRNLAEKIAEDSSGNLVVVGTVVNSDSPSWQGSTPSFPGAMKIYAGNNSSGSSLNDIFVAKVDTLAGEVLWLDQIDVNSAVTEGGAESDEGYGVVLDTNDNVFVVGTNNTPHAFVLKLQPNGASVIDSYGFGTYSGINTDYENTEGFAVAMHETGVGVGYLFVAGYYEKFSAPAIPATAFVASFSFTATEPSLTFVDIVEFPSVVAGGESWINSLSLDKANKKIYAVGDIDTATTGVDAFVAPVDYNELTGVLSKAATPYVTTAIPGTDTGNDIEFGLQSGDYYLVGRVNTTSGLIDGVVGPAGYIIKNLTADGVYDYFEEVGSTQIDNFSGVSVLNLGGGATDSVFAVGNTDGAVADLTDALGTGALTVIRDGAGDFGYDLFDNALTSDELYRDVYFKTNTANLFGETTGSVVSGFTTANANEDVFITTSIATKN